MKKRIFNMLRESSPKTDILRGSTKAVCGAFEREKVVPNSQVASTKKRLKEAGYIIVGTGDAGFNRTKIWFNPAGVNL